MPADTFHYTNILRFWRSIETFTLPDIAKPGANDEVAVLDPGDLLPWENPEFPAPAEGRRWRHTLYFYLVKKEVVVSLLAKITGSTEYREPVGGETCLAALVVDHNGRPGVRSYAPSAFVHAIKLIRGGHDPEILTERLKDAQDAWQSRFEIRLDGDQVASTWTLLEKELAYLEKLTGGSMPTEAPVLCISEQVGPLTTPEAPFLNSYYIQDLDELIRHPRSIGAPLRQLLTPQIEETQRRDLLDPRVMFQYLHPGNLAPGRWPANPAHGLYSAQMAAVNIVRSSFGGASSSGDSGARSGGAARDGLLGINGPPGTGKTTLLREVIADIVVSRAKRLLKTRVDNLFSHGRSSLSEQTSYYDINEEVFGNDGIVVASNNNTAVENISKELPLLSSIDIESFRDAEYFSTVATAMNGTGSWGLLSAVLGKSGNRSAFVDKFWFNKAGNFNKHLRELADEADSAIGHFKAAARELKGLLKEYERFQKLAVAWHEGDASVAGILFEEFGVSADHLPGSDFTELSFEAIHRMTPYSSEKVNLLRSHIFLLSLELHEWAIRANPRYFQTNLGAFVDMLLNKHRDKINEGIAATLWRSFFFCVPVVSVTLASFGRQFSKLGTAGIGVLLLDEAGQATLPSVCGAIWRSKRSILIGDTMQIQPVVTIPEALGRLLQGQYKINDDVWSPLMSSAQSLADRATSEGSWLGAGLWTGIPLRAHRRCDEPMFSIANAIAYDGQMVRVSGGPVSDAPASSWIDVQGFTSSGHAIVEELDAVEFLLQQLVNYTGKIFIISPFKTIAEACKERFYRRGKIECGTIHTFQGKEAETVLLVLGTLPANKRARDWVSATPNILNVAITRARHRLYVIGNRKVWSEHRFFDFLAKSLPTNHSANPSSRF